MTITTIHREDVKAILRKRYGSAEAFQEEKGLTGQQVRDFLRGRSSKALAAIAEELGVDPDHLIITNGRVPTCGSADSNEPSGAHRLSARAA